MFYKEDLDKLECQCKEPGCTGTPVLISAKCHTGDPVYATYYRDGAKLRLNCQCGQGVAEIAVAKKDSQAENALKVIVLDKNIRTFLKANDPMALKQCEDALKDLPAPETKRWIGVEVYGLIVTEVHVFNNKAEAEQWFEKYTGVAWEKFSLQDTRRSYCYDQTKIFEVDLK